MNFPICIDNFQEEDDSLNVPRSHAINRNHYGYLKFQYTLDHESIPYNMGMFRLENGQYEKNVHIPRKIYLENPEQEERWYFKYFMGQLHKNYIGEDKNGEVFILSILLPKLHFNNNMYRIILWQPKIIRRTLAFELNKGRKINNIKSLLSFCFNVVVDRTPKEVMNKGLVQELFQLEKDQRSSKIKFGVVYAKHGQFTDGELFGNVAGSEEFEMFVKLLGDKIRLKNWKGYAGGLDTKNDNTGKHSIYTVYEGHETMFHVSTYLPYHQHASVQLERKRHIGNDLVTIVFQDSIDDEAELMEYNLSILQDKNDVSSTVVIQRERDQRQSVSSQDDNEFQPSHFKSNVQHVFALVKYLKKFNAYKLKIFSLNGVNAVGPRLPNPPIFTDHNYFRDFLMVKLINARKSVLRSSIFECRRISSLSARVNGISSKILSSNLRSDNHLIYNQHQTDMVNFGQEMKVREIENGIAPISNLTTKMTDLEIWTPQMWHNNFSFDIVCGDSCFNCLMVATNENGVYLIDEAVPWMHEQIIDRTLVVKRITVVEDLGFVAIQTETGKIYLIPLTILLSLMSEKNTDMLKKLEMKKTQSLLTSFYMKHIFLSHKELLQNKSDSFSKTELKPFKLDQNRHTITDFEFSNTVDVLCMKIANSSYQTKFNEIDKYLNDYPLLLLATTNNKKITLSVWNRSLNNEKNLITNDINSYQKFVPYSECCVREQIIGIQFVVAPYGIRSTSELIIRLNDNGHQCVQQPDDMFVYRSSNFTGAPTYFHRYIPGRMLCIFYRTKLEMFYVDNFQPFFNIDLVHNIHSRIVTNVAGNTMNNVKRNHDDSDPFDSPKKSQKNIFESANVRLQRMMNYGSKNAKFYIEDNSNESNRLSGGQSSSWQQSTINIAIDKQFLQLLPKINILYELQSFETFETQNDPFSLHSKNAQTTDNPEDSHLQSFLQQANLQQSDQKNSITTSQVEFEIIDHTNNKKKNNNNNNNLKKRNDEENHRTENEQKRNDEVDLKNHEEDDDDVETDKKTNRKMNGIFYDFELLLTYNTISEIYKINCLNINELEKKKNVSPKISCTRMLKWEWTTGAPVHVITMCPYVLSFSSIGPLIETRLLINGTLLRTRVISHDNDASSSNTTSLYQTIRDGKQSQRRSISDNNVHDFVRSSSLSYRATSNILNNNNRETSSNREEESRIRSFDAKTPLNQELTTPQVNFLSSKETLFFITKNNKQNKNCSTNIWNIDWNDEEKSPEAGEFIENSQRQIIRLIDIKQAISLVGRETYRSVMEKRNVNMEQIINDQ
ncbi:hypothetical protein SNEBB_002701 [Seison nebaliae]|nr:hypothetical protein SNEBB_002701 [Seison nebaliae]